MSDLDKDLEKNDIVHVKKHDHSVLGKHTKKEKQQYLEELKKPKTPKPEDKNKNEHIKKDDHSFLGKHTREEKQKYLEGLKKTENTKVKVEKEEPLIETEFVPQLEPILEEKKVTKRKPRNSGFYKR